MSGPFKMNGYTYPGTSPMRQPGYMPQHLRDMKPTTKAMLDIFPGVGDTGVKATFSGDKQSSVTTFTPGHTFENRYGEESGSIGLQMSASSVYRDKKTLSGKGSRALQLNAPWQPTNTYTGLHAQKDFSGDRGPRGLHTALSGSLKGTAGFRDLFSPKSWKNPKKGKFTYGVRGEVGIGSRAYNIRAFGEHKGKHHLLGEGTTFGISGKGGLLKGSVGYNIKTKKPEFTLGLNIGR